MAKGKSKIVFKGRTIPENQVLESWHKDDPEHQKADVEFFIKPAPGVEHLTVEKDGETMFFVTIENVARVHIQFNPTAGKLKVLKTLMIGFTWLQAALKERSYREMIFDSRFAPLIKFCQSALGFIKLNQDYSTRL
jgi:hypothetical protein